MRKQTGTYIRELPDQ